MRVIAGKCKGRALKAVPGRTTRPTTDRVKETLFNIIGPFFEGGQVLDLYGGSGSLGIEALSRGMDRAVFIDRHGPAVMTIRRNLDACGLSEQAEVYRKDAGRALNILGQRGERFDLIFLDPPYEEARFDRDFDRIVRYGLLREGGLIVAEHDVNVALPDRLSERIARFRSEAYQSHTALSFYVHE
ncbi:16S rRNA (guanine(966)-N(2))-methyltransferase RsmD [Caenibacillus caldisaponilyticus]|jgi:16S rRNA (guanine966-N2)-methyltransferase|uniref:16S rRNA (guanine(966)-N(2))-methyltransferase RsmD n=1 Tax=Caenibacillus caldisaponilyticus TaxID=1674942 RepID=UPI0009887EAD|nr:16S rRNA (guanine(966)-N(2))-methyltransferase RsmD [Caenibacillus caldisaponilyticus]